MNMITIMSKPDFFRAIEAVCPATATNTILLEVGEPLFHQGDASPGLSVVLEGCVELVRWTLSGRAVRIHAAEAGETFAEASLFAPACHCDAIAIAQTRLTTIRKEDVLSAVADNPDLATGLLHHLAGNLMQARRLLELRATSPLTDAACWRGCPNWSTRRGGCPKTCRCSRSPRMRASLRPRSIVRLRRWNEMA